jgi:hypothetical protein
VAAGYDHGFLIAGLVTMTGGLIGMIFLRPGAELRRFTALDRPATITAPVRQSA